VLRMNIVLTREAFIEWEDYDLNSYLMWITIRILNKYDPDARQPLIDLILDTAGQKGTGKWTSQAALDLGIPIPTIDAAVTSRQISAQKALRVEIAKKFQAPANGFKVVPRAELEEVRSALYTGFILAYEQGFSLLRAASEENNYGLEMEKVAAVWRFGSIIWSKVLHQIRDAYVAEPGLSSLLLDEKFSDILYKNAAGLRRVVSSMSSARVPAASLGASLNYYTAFRTERLPAFLIQAQRDFFGAHTYQRIDKEGTFHTDDWEDPTITKPK
ncbi:MAG: NADP-dependent phosphogluconate dehydrogenase, partial [Pyrinomonadaceae bacterium]